MCSIWTLPFLCMTVFKNGTERGWPVRGTTKLGLMTILKTRRDTHTGQTGSSPEGTTCLKEAECALSDYNYYFNNRAMAYDT